MTHRSPLARHRTLAAEARREAAKAKKLGQTETAREWLLVSYAHRHEIAVMMPLKEKR